MARVLLMSDVHHCELVWYGVDTDTRMKRMVEALQAEYEREPYDGLFFLGDYSLDFWVCPPFGSVLNRGKSYTEKFMKEVYPLLPPCPKYMIPGNHEQYGQERWKALTGFDRRGTMAYRDALFVLLDNFAADLDPDFNSDGTYTPVDVAYIQEQMAAHPQAKHVFLCAHEFITERESEDFKTLVREEERIMGLFAGHTHLSHVLSLGPEWGNKKLIRDGQFSYSHDIEHSTWGWREIRFEDDGTVTTAYQTPACDLLINGQMVHHEAGRQDMWTWEA